MAARPGVVTRTAFPVRRSGRPGGSWASVKVGVITDATLHDARLSGASVIARIPGPYFALENPILHRVVEQYHRQDDDRADK